MTAKPSIERLGTAAISLENWLTPPFNRVAFRRVRDILPVAEIAHDPTDVLDFQTKRVDAESLAFTDRQAQVWTIERFVQTTYTDGLLVLRDGAIAFEWYAPGQSADDEHIVFSVTKSIVGSLAGILVDKGLLDPEAPIAQYVPEIGAGGYARARVRDLLDMTVSLDFEEAYLSSDSAFARYRQVTGWHVAQAAQSAVGMHAFLGQMGGKSEPHGTVFDYLSPNSDLLGWVCERAGSRSLAALLSSLIWRPMGATSDASITLDRFGAPRAAGGLGCTLRDMARFGECMRTSGAAGGRQVIPRPWVDDTRSGGDRNAWNRGALREWIPSGCYRNQWWVTNQEDGAFFAAGIYGQWIYIAPASGVVIVRQASPPVGPADVNRFRFELEAFSAIARRFPAA